MKTIEDFYKYACENCHLKKWQIEQAWYNVSNHESLPFDVEEQIGDCFDDFVLDNDIEQSNVTLLENELDYETAFERISEAQEEL